MKTLIMDEEGVISNLILIEKVKEQNQNQTKQNITKQNKKQY